MATKTPLISTTLTTTTTGLTFSNIDQNYTDLEVIVSGTTNPAQNINLRYNGDTATNYAGTYMGGDGTSTLNGNLATQSYALSGAIYTAQTYISLTIGNYSSSAMYKALLGRTSAPGSAVVAYTSSWRSTAPITSITFTNALDAGVTISIYGISAAGTTAKASGGNKIVTDSTYWYHVFTTAGIFTPATPGLSCDYMVVAGGGGAASGGGGAGGFRLGTGLSVTGPQKVLVGAGGPGTGWASGNGTNGGDSMFSTIAATGGGGGGSGGGAVGGYGGSGGGASNVSAGNGPTAGLGNVGGYSPVEGYNGGNASSAGNQLGGGGGGGAGGAGAADSSGGYGGVGAGGTGYSNYSLINAMGIATLSGQPSSGYYYYAGGGASAYRAGAGGLGGGGAGSSGTGGNGTSGTANTGGGGGGTTFGTVGNGGSGIVIVRYLV